MINRTREWLRSYLHLDARAQENKITTGDVARQEDTVLRALELFDRQPGVVIADEVGMGKTLEALGVVAAFLNGNPAAKIVIVTPGPDLNEKWQKETATFSDPARLFYNFGQNVRAVERLDDFVPAVNENRIVIAPVSMFHSTRGRWEQSYLLSLFFWWKNLHGSTANAILNRFREGALEHIDVRDHLFLGHFCMEQIEPHLNKVFKGSRDEDEQAGLDDLFQQDGYKAFASDYVVRRALDLARFRLIRALLPVIDLLIIDEAHKLKNADTLRSQAISTVFRRRFRKALFLTATPFQLGIGELRQVFSLFAIALNAPKDILARADQFLDKIAQYQLAYSSFEHVWNTLDPGVAQQFRAYYQSDPALAAATDDPNIRLIADRIRVVRELKDTVIEPGFREWMIRSLREDKRQYRQHNREVQRPTGDAVLPFLIYERFIDELFASDHGTHKAAVEINMVSSFSAALKGALLQEDGRELSVEADAYRKLLRGILREVKSKAGKHPKLSFVIQDALAAAERGEKTLIFCTRTETLSTLKNDIQADWIARMLERWRLIYPGSAPEEIFDEGEGDERQRGRHSKLQSRFHRTQDALYLALRERHIGSFIPASEWAIEHCAQVTARANEKLPHVRVGHTSASRLDYRVLKRCVEQSAAELWREQCPIEAQTYQEDLDVLTDPLFLTLGLDLIADELENDDLGQHAPEWTIHKDAVSYVIGNGRSLYELLSVQLKPFSRETRVTIVEQLASFLTRKEVTFLADLLLEAMQLGVEVNSIESRLLLNFLDEFWSTTISGAKWLARIREFLQYLSERSGPDQVSILNGAIKTGELVRQTRDGETREKLREAFQTPLYPMILVANEVMQEGLDLHHHCRRVVHHDLAWNPAQLEQRVGRIDRLGSMTGRMREQDPLAKLDILYPLIERTIDERLYRTVRTREKWLEFLLGATPSDEFNPDGFHAPELPEGLAEALRIDLRPRADGITAQDAPNPKTMFPHS